MGRKPQVRTPTFRSLPAALSTTCENPSATFPEPATKARVKRNERRPCVPCVPRSTNRGGACRPCAILEPGAGHGRHRAPGARAADFVQRVDPLALDRRWKAKVKSARVLMHGQSAGTHRCLEARPLRSVMPKCGNPISPPIARPISVPPLSENNRIVHPRHVPWSCEKREATRPSR